MAVIDASIWVALFHEKDVFHPTAIQIIESALNHRIHVPALVFAEVSGAIRRRTGSIRSAWNAVSRMQDFDLDLRDIDEPFGRLAADLAARLGLRGADACYVALAKETGRVLYTFDDEQFAKSAEEIETRRAVTPPKI